MEPEDKKEETKPAETPAIPDTKDDINATLGKICDGLVNAIPEDMKKFVPNLPLPDRLEWLINADKAGFWNRQEPKGIDPKTPPKPHQGANLDTMSPIELINFGLKNTK